MKKKDIQELRTKDIQELKALLTQAREKLLSLQLEKAQYKLKNLRSLFMQRKDIAKIQTILSEKEKQNE